MINNVDVGGSWEFINIRPRMGSHYHWQISLSIKRYMHVSLGVNHLKEWPTLDPVSYVKHFTSYLCIKKYSAQCVFHLFACRLKKLSKRKMRKKWRGRPQTDCTHREIFPWLMVLQYCIVFVELSKRPFAHLLIYTEVRMINITIIHIFIMKGRIFCIYVPVEV